jgi:hypothetical protein
VGHSTACTTVKDMCPAIIKNYKSELMLLHQEKSWKRILDNMEFP